MKKMSVWLMTGLLSLGTTAAFGIPQSPEEDADGPQLRERGFRGERGMRGRRGNPQARFDRMMDRMSDQLGLSDDQYSQFDEIVQPYQEAIAARFEKMRQIRDAEEAGDYDTVDQIRAELETAPRPREMFREMLTEVEPILTTDQQQTLTDMRERMQQRGRRFGQGRRMLRELPDKLNMDESQRAEYEEMMQTQRAEMRERFENMRALRDERRLAEEEGDMETADALREEMRSLRPNFEEFIPNVLAQVEPMLTDEQKETLTSVRAEMEEQRAERGQRGARGERGQRGQTMRLRDYFRAVQKLDLESDQKEQIREIEGDAKRIERELRRNREAAAEAFQKVDAEVRAILNAEQKTQLDELVKKGERRGRRDRGQRPPR